MSLIETTARPVLTIEDEIDLAYMERAETAAEEADLADFNAFMETNGIPLPYEQQEEPAYFQTAKPLRRPSHEARNMTRTGSRSPHVRKNHGTKLRYAEIKAENAARRSRKKNSVRAQRRFNKLVSSCNNSRTIARAKLELLGKR